MTTPPEIYSPGALLRAPGRAHTDRRDDTDSGIVPSVSAFFRGGYSDLNAFRAAAMVRSMSSAVWAMETKAVSNWEGAR